MTTSTFSDEPFKWGFASTTSQAYVVFICGIHFIQLSEIEVKPKKGRDSHQNQ